MAFGAISSEAWRGIYAAGAAFALTHWFGKKIPFVEVLSAQKNGDCESDDLKSEINRISQKLGKKTIMARKAFHVVTSSPLGILTGYYGIKHQSVWVAVGIHSAWNLVMPIIVPITIQLLIFFGTLAITCLSSLWKRGQTRRRS